MAIDLAKASLPADLQPPPTFVVADAESMQFENEFDAVIFFDALHHSVDEQAAVKAAYRALKPGGVFVASETGPGHEEASVDVSDKYDVTEKSMPPRKIVKLGKTAGFQKRQVFPRADALGQLMYSRSSFRRGLKRLLTTPPLHLLLHFAYLTFGKSSYGIVKMTK